MTDSVLLALGDTLSLNTQAIRMQTEANLSIFHTAILVLAMLAMLSGWRHGQRKV